MPDQKRNAAGRAGNGLNASQRAAAAFDGPGPLLVLAGPGSGKTLTITRRIRYLLLEKAVPPEKILVITFTREAALSMRDRFLRDSGDIPQQILQTVNFGTFHSIFYQILRQSKGIKENQILGETDKKKILLSALSSVMPEKSGQEKTYYARDLLSAIGFFKNTGDLKKTVQKVPTDFQDAFRRIYAQYERARTAQGKMDFDDMLLDCRTLLAENEGIRAYWQERFPQILIDEFQDINPVQYGVIRLLSGEPYSIFAVGDDDQAIYGFRGSSPACMQRFLEDYGAERILLDTNYRSLGEIVRASLKVIGENQCRFHKELKAGREDGGDGRKNGGDERKEDGAGRENGEDGSGRKYDGNEREDGEDDRKYGGHESVDDGDRREDNGQGRENFGFSKTDNRTEPGDGTFETERVRILGFTDQKEENAFLLKLCESAEDCAVLFRTNRLMQRFAVRLQRAGIPFEMREKARNPYLADVVLDIMAYLRLGAGEGDPELVYRIVNKPSRYVDREALRGMKGSGDPLESLEVCYQRRSQSVMEKIQILRRHLCAMEKMSPYLGLQYVRRVIGYDRWLQERYADNRRELEEQLELLDWLGEEAKEFHNLQDWLEEQRDYQGQGTRENAGNRQIKLMTVHASKGLEFRHVVIPDCNERIYPYGQMLETDSVEEERRIFYVAMTRAKDRIDLLYLTGTKDHPMERSRFLNAL